MDGSGRRWAWVRLAVVAAAVAFAGAKTQSLWPRLAGVPAPATAAVPGSPAGGAVLRPIEQVRLGDRVPGENPAEGPDGRFGAEVEPASWRRVDLSCRKRDGTAAAVSLLRPAWWLEARGAEVGGTLMIAVPECGIDGDAEVLAIGPCPPVAPGRGSVVTGTFRHANAAVIDLHVAGLDGPVGTTPNHKFWSGERGAFVRADALGYPQEARAGGHTVYNLETYPHHVYRVSAAGLLVHNTDPSPAASAEGMTTVGRWMHYTEYLAMMKTGTVQAPSNGAGVTMYTVPPNPDAWHPMNIKESVFA